MKRATKHEKKMRWLGENQPFLEANYPGMWVAISDQGFAAAGTTFGEAEQAAMDGGCEEPLVVPIKAKQYQDVYVIR
jgi:hypothetical protein